MLNSLPNSLPSSLPNSLLGDVLDLVLPRDCAGCRARGAPLCAECAQLLLAPPSGAHRPTPCPSGFPDTRVHSAFGGPLRRLLLAHKERGRLGLTEPLGAALGRAVRLLDPPAGTVLVPVPSSPAAVRTRGHDHARRLARVAAAELGLQAEPLLGLARRTADQAGLDTAARAANLRGALRAGSPSGLRTVVVVDDVVTTGATLVEACRALEAAGHRVVGAATIGATVRRNR